jgi:hypothetical protein
MPEIESFIDETVRDLRERLSTATSRARRGIEDRLALLTDYRLSSMDETPFERLLVTLDRGRSPVWMQSLRPETVGDDLARRWRRYQREGGQRPAPAAN